MAEVKLNRTGVVIEPRGDYNQKGNLVPARNKIRQGTDIVWLKKAYSDTHCTDKSNSGTHENSSNCEQSPDRLVVCRLREKISLEGTEKQVAMLRIAIKDPIIFSAGK